MAPKGPASGNEAAHRRWEQTRVREVALQVVQMPPAEEAPRCCVTTTHGGHWHCGAHRARGQRSERLLPAAADRLRHPGTCTAPQATKMASQVWRLRNDVKLHPNLGRV